MIVTVYPKSDTIKMKKCSGRAWEGYDEWDPESEKTGIRMSWAKQENGTYKLVYGESGQSKPLSNGRLEQFE